MTNAVEVFKYSGALKNGEKQRGYIVAPDRDTALSLLEKRGIYATRLKKIPLWMVNLMPVDGNQIALVFDGLSKMISAGITQLNAIEYLIREQFNPRLAIVLYQIKDNLQNGMGFAKAFEETGFFPKDVVKMIEVGVESGKLIDVLQNLKEYYQQKESIKKAVISAVAYPAGITIVLFLVVIFGAPKLITPMMQFYKSFEGKVDFPQFTLVVINLVNMIGKASPFILIGTVLLIYLFMSNYKNNPAFKGKVDSIFLRLPVVGTFQKKLAVYKFLLSMSILYRAGIPIAEALKMVASTMGNEEIKQEFLKTYEQVVKGISFDRAIRSNRFVPNMVKSLIAIGVEAGSLDRELDTLSKYEKEAFKAYVNFIKSIAMPVSMVVGGGVIGVIIIAVYLPILNMVDMLKHP